MRIFTNPLKKQTLSYGASVLGLFFLCAASAFGQMRPSAPVTNFSLPMFDEAGNKTWQLAGSEGRYLSQEQIDVIDMKLTLFRGSQEEPEVEAIIESPFASVFVQETRAKGNQGFSIVSPTFEVSGTNWTWDGNRERITVQENARVIFLQDISNILR